jgi:hypothetical protein
MEGGGRGVWVLDRGIAVLMVVQHSTAKYRTLYPITVHCTEWCSTALHSAALPVQQSSV